jgi:glutamate N-acetyltransferase / amino-acid N-acetyltransferase
MNDSPVSPASIHLPSGFSLSALAAGIKVSGRPDLALIASSPGTKGAAVFTSNRIVAAPLQVAKASLRSSRGSVRAVVVNSGNANCATGEAGVRGCQQVCREVAKMLSVRPEEVFPSSTGIIGVPFPTAKITAALPELVRHKQARVDGVRALAEAIMTTDTRPKISSASFRFGDRETSVLGVAKGSGMIHPQLATMLVYILTDLAATSAAQLKRILLEACDETFNCVSVDGDTSTNDTVLLLASGQSGVLLSDTGAPKQFRAALLEVCHSLAAQIVSDGEGVQHVIRLVVEQARSDEEARQVARAISRSLLVKTAWAGADPNWGRILSAVGYSGVPVNPQRVNIYIGDQMVCQTGQAHPFDEKQAHEHLSQVGCAVRIQLGRGRRGTRFYTTDLTAEYVRINADYST